MAGTDTQSARRGRAGVRVGAGRGLHEGMPEVSKTTLGAGVEPLSGGGGIFKSAAVAVLRRERKLMTTGDITRVALERGLINCQGKTPEATMASALYTDVKRKHNKSVFTRPQEGLFGLREWIAEGFFPEGWSAPADSQGVAPYKRRGQPLGSRSSPLKGTRNGAARGGRRRAATSAVRRGTDESGGEWEEDSDEEGLTEGDMEPGASMRAALADGSTPSGPAAAASGLGRHPSPPPPFDDPRGMATSLVSHGGTPTQDAPETGGAAPSGGGHQDSGSRQNGDGSVDRGAGQSPSTGGPTRSRPRRAAADTSYVNGVPSRRETRDGTAGSGRAGMLDLGGLAHDELDLESPLHVLGDVALSAQEREASGALALLDGGTLPPPPPPPHRPSLNGRTRMGPSKWETQRPTHIQVPGHRSGGGMMHLPPGADAPKSPYEDSLAALHEIATGGSPHHFAALAAAAAVAAAGGGAGGAPVNGAGRKRPRLHVHIGDPADEPAQGPVTDLAGYHAYDLPSPLMSTGRGRRNQPAQFIHPLPSPAEPYGGGAGRGYGHGLLGAVDFLQGPQGDVLLSPSYLQLLRHTTASQLHALCMDGPDGDRRLFSMDGSFSAQGPALPYEPSAHAFGRAPHQGPPEERFADAEGLRLVVLRLESKLGRCNPIMAKAWLALARMFHSLADPLGAPAAAKAADALKQAAACAADACAALSTPWLGAAHFEALQRSVAAVVATASAGTGSGAAGPTAVLTTLPAAAVLARGGQAGPAITYAPPTVIPAPRLSAGGNPATGVPGGPAGLPATLALGGSGGMAVPTMQVIPAPAANGLHAAPQHVPVLNLDARDDDAAPGSGKAGGGGGGLGKLVLAPPGPPPPPSSAITLAPPAQGLLLQGLGQPMAGPPPPPLHLGGGLGAGTQGTAGDDRAEEAAQLQGVGAPECAARHPSFATSQPPSGSAQPQAPPPRPGEEVGSDDAGGGGGRGGHELVPPGPPVLAHA